MLEGEKTVDYYSVGLAIEPHLNLVTGFIHTHNESFALEPASRFFNKRTSFDMVIYKWIDVQIPVTSNLKMQID